ncbi:phosphoenolpyruvate mutase [Virgibacillus sp. DJP39]|uniref:phosphoenolpyruvate mutase n=1 Tax=Virgibacillus sp. DJP39 TaxID=3409790 RepID=UPI003BB66AD2
MIQNKNKTLRDLLNTKKLSKVAGAHDGLSAKLAEKNGFDAIWASGLGISAIQTVPDASILTMTEFLEAAIIMNDSCNIPVIADCDSGFGNIHNVDRMIKKYESSGISGVCLEDKVFPKLNSFDDREQLLVSSKEFCAKIKTAKDSRVDNDFVIIARVEALIAGLGQDEAYNRAKAYSEAGADAILIHSKQKNPNEIVEFIKRWDLSTPLVVVPTKYPSITMGELENLGVRFSIYANQSLRASVKAMDEVLSNIMKNGSTEPIENKISNVSDIFDLQDIPKMKKREEIVYSK